MEESPHNGQPALRQLLEEEANMPQFRHIRKIHPVIVFLAALTCASLANADDIVSFATGGYARGLRTMSEMHKIDTDGDGTVSHDEFIAYQTKIFDMMDANKGGMVGAQDFLGK
jgi:EF hand